MPDNTLRACALSSMINTRRPRKSDCRMRRRGAISALPRRAVKRKVLPLPSSLVTSMVPPISSASRLEMARPRPVPPYLRVVDASACSKAWKQTPDLLLGHADAGVAHREQDELALLGILHHLGPDHHLTLFGELDRVVAEVDQDLPKPQRIAAEMSRTTEGSMSKISSSPLADAFSEIRLLTFSSTLSRSNSMFSTVELASLDLREVENVVDDAEEMLAGMLDLDDVVPLARHEVRL